MKFRNLIIALLVLLSLALVVTASGIDDEGNANDPNLNNRANACFEGGSLEGRCDTVDIDENGTVDEWEIEWHYVCGWYLIRYENGLIGQDNLPDGCQIPVDLPATSTKAAIDTPGVFCPGTDLFPPCPTT